jgi:polysaccharide export outer membrane protein
MRKLFPFYLLILLLPACMPNSKMVYVQDDRKDEMFGMEYLNERKRTLIQIFDELYIEVNSFDENNPNFLNNDASRLGGRTSTDYSLIAYRVDEEGNINLPLIGKLKVVNLTVDEVASLVQGQLGDYLYSPSVRVSFVNKNVTVLGYVASPGRYFYSGEYINVFQALGLAGDIEEYGNRKELVVIREENGRITKHLVDLTDKDLLQNDLYYLKSNDVVYVQPLTRRNWGIDQVPFSLILSSATTFILILDYMRRNN